MTAPTYLDPLVDREEASRILLSRRRNAFARVIYQLVGPALRFSGPVPHPDFEAYAELALRLGFDPFWAEEWIRAGFPRPPVWIEKAPSHVDLSCRHARQMTPFQEMLPCANPGCEAGRRAGARWMTMVLPRDPFPFSVSRLPPVEVPPNFIRLVWERIEYSDGTWFWRCVNKHEIPEGT